MSGFKENRHAANSHESMTRLPELANEVIPKEPHRRAGKLKDAESWQRETGRSSETIVKYPEFRIVLIRMKPGSYMSTTALKVRFLCMRFWGKIRVHFPTIEQRNLFLETSSLLSADLSTMLKHWKSAPFLLTIAWPEATAPDHA